MTDTTKPAVKAKTPTKAAQIAFLEGEAKARDAELQRRAERIRELEEILASRQKTAATAEAEALADRKALALLMNAIKPVEAATRDWKWPNEGLRMISKLTFGHLKAVLTAYTQVLNK